MAMRSVTWTVWALDSMLALNLIKSRIVVSYRTLSEYKKTLLTFVIFRLVDIGVAICFLVTEVLIHGILH